MPNEEGTYKVSAVFDNYAHPTCGEAEVRVSGNSGLPAVVYAEGLSEDVLAILQSLNVRVAALTDQAGQGDTVMVAALSEQAKAAAARGAKVVAMSSENLSDTVAYAFVDGRAIAVTGSALAASEATVVVPAIGFNGNAVMGGAVVSICDYESGRLVTCTVAEQELVAAALLAR